MLVFRTVSVLLLLLWDIQGRYAYSKNKRNVNEDFLQDETNGLPSTPDILGNLSGGVGLLPAGLESLPPVTESYFSDGLLNSFSQAPRIDLHHSPDVIALKGFDSQLVCRVHNLGNRTVSWLKHGEVHLLAVGRYTYTSDLRFEAVHRPNTQDWILRLRSPTPKDSGTYECQVSSTPHLSHNINLIVKEAESVILGGPDMIVAVGSTINLTCLVKNTPKPPQNVGWFLGTTEITYQGPRPGVSLITDKGVLSISTIILTRAVVNDSGTYYCVPKPAPTATINLHVIQGNTPAELSSGDMHAPNPLVFFAAVLVERSTR